MTNKELGKKIWGNINFSNFYAEDFEAWYSDCFAECMDEASESIFNGSCTYENGSFVEISRTISKSGNPVVIDVEKENFVEFYGEVRCLEMFGDEE